MAVVTSSARYERGPRQTDGFAMAAFRPVFVRLRTTLLVLSAIILTHSTVAQAAKVCVVGAGIGGSSVSYFLQQQSGFNDEVVVFERYGNVGGRARVVNVDGDEFEAGASIIHEKNIHLVGFASALGLETKTPGDLDFGLWNGESFLFQEMKEDSPLGFLAWLYNVALLAWRYGPWALARMNNFIQDTLAKWMRLYDNDLPTFERPEEMLRHIDLFDLTLKPLSQVLQSQEIPPSLAQELVTMIIRIQYGQSAEISGLAGAVGLCGTGSQLWQVKGGNWQLADGVLRLSRAQVFLNTTVTGIVRTHASHAYSLLLRNGSAFGCDAVVIAAPLEESGLEIEPPVEKQPKREYHHTHVTFVRGKLNATYFGLSREADLPGLIGTVEAPNIPFCCISQQSSPTPDRNPVFKIFSRTAFTDAQINSVFREHGSVVRLDWAAYPEYKAPEGFSPFILDGNHLYYINTFESGASALETAAVAAKNVAGLLHQRLQKSQRKDGANHEEGKGFRAEL